ncbi:RecX family transcriptional regulator [Anaerotignum sp.]|nr:RecX family transcriptional regulator [Anaerotignum sp.]MBQ7758840.1 RecX family transcriptional regulator [Anaerotignum sp.]
MLVTAITQQKKDATKYNIFIDGEYAFALPMQDILYFKLKEGKEVAEETVAFIQKNLIYIKAQDTALHFIGYKMRTVKEIRQKLTEKEFAEETIDEVIAFLEKYGYADDREYCRKYIKEKLRMKPKSGYALKIELKQRGISSRIIDEVMAETEVDEEGDAFRWLEKKSRGQWPPADEKQKKKYYDFLLRKGYSYDIIGEAFRQMNEAYGGED